MTEQEYWQEVRDMAKAALDEPRDERHDWLWESVDGHEFVIYTHKARLVLLHSKNEDAIFDEGMWDGQASSMLDVYTKAAFFAFLADIREELSSLEDEEEDEVEDEEDEVEDEEDEVEDEE